MRAGIMITADRFPRPPRCPTRWRKRNAAARWLPFFLAILVFSLLASAVEAGTAVKKKKKTPRRSRSSAVYKKYREAYASAYVVEAETGKVLFSKDPDQLRAPASLAKMMTELITLEALERDLVSFDDIVTIPAAVRQVGGSRVRLRPGERVTVRDLLHATAIPSANDAALALAIHLGGSEAAFVRLMNQRARELGMSRTSYANPHGLDRADRTSITTARDQSILARELIRHPHALEIASTACDTIRGCQVIHTTNRLLGSCEGVDGLKTGYTGRAGFCLASTAERDGMRVISVLLGGISSRRRFAESEGLLANAFARFKRIPVIRKGQDLGRTCAIQDGATPRVRLLAGEDVAVLLPASHPGEIRMDVEAPSVLHPPIEAGAAIGRLRVWVGDSLAVAVPAVAAREVQRAGLFDRVGQFLGVID